MGLWAADGGSGVGPAQSLKNSGTFQLERIKKTREQRPEVVVVAHEKTAREDCGTMPGESFSWTRHAESEILPRITKFKTLARVVQAVAAGLDEGRTKNLEVMNAFFHQFYRVLEETSKDENHNMNWAYPMLNIKDPFAPRPRTGWASMERNALTLYHREEHTMEQVRKQYSGSQASGGGSGKGAGGGGSSGDSANAEQIKKLVAAEVKRRKGEGKDAKGGPKGGGRGAQGGGAAAAEVY